MSITISTYAKSYTSFCFTKHIQESIAINLKRKLVYGELTHGRSNRIFNRLIAFEYLTLAPASIFDLRAMPFQRQGMELFCHEFMSMNKAPDFDPDLKVIPEQPFAPFDWSFYKERVAEGLRHKSAFEIRRAAVEGLIELKKQPNYYCFSRHMLESIYRFAYFLPLREEEAQKLGLGSPSQLIMDVVRLHLLGMKDSYKIDLLSQPIQMSGIPMLCSEIPDLLFDLDDPELAPLKGQG